MRIQLLATGTALAFACAAPAALAQATSAPEAASTPAAASAPALPVPAPTVQAPAPVATHVAANTVIVIEITELISTKIQKKGDMFTLKLAEPIKLGDVVVVPADTPGMGQVVDTAPPGFGGAPGKLVLAARYLELNGKHIPIHALKLGGSGQDRNRLALAMSAMPYVGIASILIQGGQMEIPPGSHALAKLGVDLPAPDASPAMAADPTPAAAPAPTTAAPAPTTSNTTPQGTPQ
ncbi:MAG TPA: hypothetical protein VG407_04075 [Caulobacteraceae bacterium]|jgi:hypothetical protein|nr:hypothetical protein [Caulobacteraceae bacterium]